MKYRDCTAMSKVDGSRSLVYNVPWTMMFTAVWKSTSASGAPDNSSLSHFSAMTRPSWLGRAARNRHRHAIEQVSRRWRGGRRGDSARTRRKFDFHTGYGERLVWDGEDAARSLLRVAAKNVPLKHVRKAVAEAVGEEEAGALASDEAIRVSGLSQCGTFFRRPTPTTRTT